MPLMLCTSGGQPYDAIVVRPTAAEASTPPPPLIVAPHGNKKWCSLKRNWCRLTRSFVAGGPHAGYVAEFMVWPACLAQLGFAVLLGKLVLFKKKKNLAHFIFTTPRIDMAPF